MTIIPSRPAHDTVQATSRAYRRTATTPVRHTGAPALSFKWGRLGEVLFVILGVAGSLSSRRT